MIEDPIVKWQQAKVSLRASSRAVRLLLLRSPATPLEQTIAREMIWTTLARAWTAKNWRLLRELWQERDFVRNLFSLAGAGFELKRPRGAGAGVQEDHRGGSHGEGRLRGRGGKDFERQGPCGRTAHRCRCLSSSGALETKSCEATSSPQLDSLPQVPASSAARMTSRKCLRRSLVSGARFFGLEPRTNRKPRSFAVLGPTGGRASTLTHRRRRTLLRKPRLPQVRLQDLTDFLTRCGNALDPSAHLFSPDLPPH